MGWSSSSWVRCQRAHGTLSTLFLIVLLTSSSTAHPYRQQPLHHDKRQDVLWVTQTIDTTTTIWVQEGFDANTVLVSSVARPTSPNSSSSAYGCPLSSSTLTPTTSAVTAVYEHAALFESRTEISPAVADVQKWGSEYNASAPTTSSTLAPSTISSSSSSGECSSGNPCEGDITYYTAGLGACGTTSDGDTQKVVALPHGLMGLESNNNPYCGQTITITCIATGKSTTATVADKCMGCDDFSIDLSNAAFLDLEDLAVGRTKATWYFN